ncbi:MAG TPA: 30S ribosomal protein S6 [Candidatus Paceibacterota bacterium]|nr:30S ribosomal protein S6 [Candidatus Paceibacterota bacterium]
MAEMSQTAQVSSQANVSSQPVYEVGYHVVPTVGDEGVAGVVTQIKSALGPAEIISDSFPAKMRLAYTVERSTTGKREKYDDAYFGFIKFATDREAIPALEEMLRANKSVLRFLLIETTREDISAAPRRAVFTSDRLEGETISKPVSAPEEKGEVSEAELDKSIDALVSE